jgi:hypothetical protein
MQLRDGSYGSYWKTQHDFFLTVPNLHNDINILRYQQAFVDKILSHTFKYDHVLYCMTNEIFTQYSHEWGWYWARYIKNKAKETGKKVNVAEMYQNHDLNHQQHRATLDHPEIFDFIDISQNSRQLDDKHWQRLQWVRQYIAENLRPINHTKTYGCASRIPLMPQRSSDTGSRRPAYTLPQGETSHCPTANSGPSFAA